MIRTIRLSSQQLAGPLFKKPKDLVAWMGAVQAQDYTQVKWAVGMRLKAGALPVVERALRKGEIIRTHILRPTWHLVAAADLRWMMRLCSHRIRSAYDSFARGRGLEMPPALYSRCNDRVGKLLEGGRHLTKKEIGEGLKQAGLEISPDLLTWYLTCAETDLFVCSGADRQRQVTYALVDERIAPVPERTREESLAELATRYFRSHSPARLDDFTWWSGLPLREARQATGLIAGRLVGDRFASERFLVYESCRDRSAGNEETFHLLPAFDEYLISYKDRSDVLEPAYRSRVFNLYGTFYPVVVGGGRVIGNWKKSVKKGTVTVETSFFEPQPAAAQQACEAAAGRYKAFLG